MASMAGVWLMMKSEVGMGQVVNDLKALKAIERSLNFILRDIILYIF